MRQVEILAAIRDRLAPGADLDRFIAEHAGAYDILLERSRRLGEGAIAVAYRRRTVLLL
jgi:hypothetical protein